MLMAIDTKISETLKNLTRIKSVRRRGSPEPSCQLPTAPAHSCLILLTRGQYAIVDDYNFEWLNLWNWYAKKSIDTFYAVREDKDGKNTFMHRQILEILDVSKGMVTDHKNHNGLDNRECNIRICTNAENQYNRRKIKATASVYKGIGWHKRDKIWYARIKQNQMTEHIGYYKSEIDAAKAYDAKALELFGEFAYTNF